MKKILGILVLLALVFAAVSLANPVFFERFVSPYNLQNLIRWTSLYGILSIGVAFVILTGGIDLSIGSVVGLVGALMPMMLVQHGLSIGVALALVVLLSLAIGLLHGLLITLLDLQPFIVTLCGLLFYRGFARYLTDDRTQGFGGDFEGLRSLATGEPFRAAVLLAAGGACYGLFHALRAARAGARERRPALARALWGALLAGAGALALTVELPVVSQLSAPAPFLVLLALALVASVFLRHTIWGRYLYALGRNEQAARYSGIPVRRMVVLAYVVCSLCAGLGGVLFALDVNSVQPAVHGNFYELYAIAAAVLGGCSLRGGEGAVLGVVLGAGVMRVLKNSINLLEISNRLEFAIIGVVILLGVVADEVVARIVARRREGQRRAAARRPREASARPPTVGRV